jgi:hypothetical protein
MISPPRTVALGQAKLDELHQASEAHRSPPPLGPPGRRIAAEENVTLRLGSPADQASLARLAELDSSTPPAQPVLLAEVDGQVRAALSLTGGTVIADPFYPTAQLIDLLRARVRQLDTAPRSRVSGACPHGLDCALWHGAEQTTSRRLASVARWPVPRPIRGPAICAP